MTAQLEQLMRFVPPEKKANLAKLQEMLGVSQGAAVALSLCQEAIRDYAPAEGAEVTAALFGIYARKRADQ